MSEPLLPIDPGERPLIASDLDLEQAEGLAPDVLADFGDEEGGAESTGSPAGFADAIHNTDLPISKPTVGETLTVDELRAEIE